jgi:Fic family protein
MIEDSMKFEEFKSGVWKQQYQYKSFSPVQVNQQWSWEDPEINALMEKATKALGELNAFSLIVPDIDLFIQMHIIKEAQTSSKIEGTRTGIDEAILSEEFIAPEKRDDWREVRNYIDAMNGAITELNSLPLSNRLLKNTHYKLMQGVRGEHKQPGEFRSTQNWIGGSGIMDAAFIPPHFSEVQDLMSNLESFWHNEAIIVPDLVRAAITHYQFETIHPFCDGNGRVGRLLIPLYLISKGILSKPSLYLSDFFEKHKRSYIDALMNVRLSNDLINWIKFFLNGVMVTAEKGRDTFRSILALQNKIEKQLHTLGRRYPSAHQTMKVLYQKPLITISELETLGNISKVTANAVIKDLELMGILRKVSGKERYRVYVFDEYLSLFLD